VPPPEEGGRKEQRKMTTQMNREVSVWTRKTRALAAGLLVAG